MQARLKLLIATSIRTLSSESIGNVILSRLPEIKCICGFRVFRKARQPIVKQLKAI